MKKKPVNSLFEGAPEEIEDLQLTEEEIGMIYSGTGGSEKYICPYCKEDKGSETTLERHISLCPKNPNKAKPGPDYA